MAGLTFGASVAVAGTLGYSTTGMGTLMVAGGISGGVAGAVQSTTEQAGLSYYHTGSVQVDWGQVGWDTAYGAGGGFVGAGVGHMLGRLAPRVGATLDDFGRYLTPPPAYAMAGGGTMASTSARAGVRALSDQAMRTLVRHSAVAGSNSVVAFARARRQNGPQGGSKARTTAPPSAAQTRGKASKGTLRSRLGDPPKSMVKPEAHHDLPLAPRFQKHWKRVGLDIEDPAYGRWVEGGRVGNHQKWSHEFNREWDALFKDYPKATRKQILNHMHKLRADARFQ